MEAAAGGTLSDLAAQERQTFAVGYGEDHGKGEKFASKPGPGAPRATPAPSRAHLTTTTTAPEHAAPRQKDASATHRRIRRAVREGPATTAFEEEEHRCGDESASATLFPLEQDGQEMA